MKITVHVPATSANLGPGFDCFGLALDWWNTIVVSPAAKLEVRLRGESAGLPADASNHTIRAMQLLFQHIGKPMPPARVLMTNRIPIARGLGSSAAALVGGLVAGNALAGTPLTAQELLELANEVEGHPDNVSAALFGGFTISTVDGGRVVSASVEPPADWRAVVFVPDKPLATRTARQVLPNEISRADAVHNIGRAALVAYAFLTRRPSYLLVGTQDRLHQPYRQPLVKGMEELIQAACAAGASGAALSGAGPSLIAFVPSTAVATRVHRAFRSAAQQYKLRGQVKTCALCARGVYVE